MLFIGLIIFLLLQPFLTAAPFALVDVLVIFALGLICFIPFGLFVRDVVSKRDPSSAMPGVLRRWTNTSGNFRCTGCRQNPSDPDSPLAQVSAANNEIGDQFGLQKWSWKIHYK